LVICSSCCCVPIQSGWWTETDLTHGKTLYSIVQWDALDDTTMMINILPPLFLLDLYFSWSDRTDTQVAVFIFLPSRTEVNRRKIEDHPPHTFNWVFSLYSFIAINHLAKTTGGRKRKKRLVFLWGALPFEEWNQTNSFWCYTARGVKDKEIRGF
jgi:hypothetical protein